MHISGPIPAKHTLRTTRFIDCTAFVNLSQRKNTFKGTVQGVERGEDGLIEKIDLSENNLSLTKFAFYVRRLSMKDMYNGESLKNPNPRWLRIHDFDFIETKHKENEISNETMDDNTFKQFMRPHSICHDV